METTLVVPEIIDDGDELVSLLPVLVDVQLVVVVQLDNTPVDVDTTGVRAVVDSTDVLAANVLSPFVSAESFSP